MLSRTEIEARIVEYIKGLETGAIVAASPEDPTQYENSGLSGCILVRYHGLSREKPPRTNSRAPRRVPATMRWTVFIGSRNLRRAGEAHQGAYDWLEQVQDGIADLVIEDPQHPEPQYRRMWFFAGEEQFTTEIGGVWWYTIDISTETMR